MKASAQIFLSYAREDKEKVENLYQKLSNAGFNPWMDKKDILAGEQWESRIPQAIRHSDFFLACLSANSIDKRGWIQREIRQALYLWQEKLDSDIYLIPVRLEDCEMPESLRRFQWVNLFEEDGWERLVKALRVGMERRAEGIKPIVQEPIPFKPYPAHEKPSPGVEIATPEKGLERVHLKVFISHSSKDDRFVQRLAGDLREAGVEVWVDVRITVGDEFVEEINQGLFDSDYVAAVLSPNSIKSHWVKKEYSAGLNREVREGKKIVLPLLIGNILDRDIPPLLSNKNYADFRKDYEAGLGALLRALMAGADFAPPSTVEAPQLVFEFEFRKEWDEIQAMLEMIEQLAPEYKGHVSALREAKAELEACVVKDNECTFFYETARWRKATEAIARFASSRYPDPDVAELAGKIGVRLASAFYCAGYRFYIGDYYREAQVLFDQALALDPWHAEAAQSREDVTHILAKTDEELAVYFAEAEEASYRGCYEDVVLIVDHIRNIDGCYRRSELDRLLDMAQPRRGGMP